MSIMDEWNRTQAEALEKKAYSQNRGAGYSAQSMYTDHYAQPAAQDDESRPIFEIEALDWNPNLQQGSIVTADVGKNVLAIGTSNGYVIRWNIDTTAFQESVIMRKGDERIHRVFIDPMGIHILVSMTNGTIFYVGEKRDPKDRPVQLSKAKGFVVESTAWFAYQGESRVQRVLVGTTKGAFYEIAFEDGKEKHCKRIFELTNDLGTSLDEPIVGIRVCLLPPVAPLGAGPDQSGPSYFVMAATPRRRYHFIGGPTIEELFASYDARNTHLNFQELPGSPSASELRFYVPPSAFHSTPQEISPLPERFAWLTGAGVFTGEFYFAEGALRSITARDAAGAGEQIIRFGELQDIPAYYDNEVDPSAMSNTSSALKSYGIGVDDDRRARLVPLSIALTEFHTIILFKNRIVAINRVNKEVVFHRLLPKEAGTLRHLCVSERSQTLFAFSDRHIYEIDISNESRDAWSIYLAQQEFDKAYKYCKAERQRELVLESQADHLFDHGMYLEAADLYARTKRPFEEIALKLVAARSPGVLIGPAAGAPVAKGNPYYGAETPSLQRIAAATATPLSLLRLATARNTGAKAADTIDVEAEAIESVTQGSRAALKKYLEAKLAQVPRELSTQTTLLCTWLVEVYLDCITTLTDSLRKLSLRRRPTTSPIATALMAAAAAAAAAQVSDTEAGSDAARTAFASGLEQAEESLSGLGLSQSSSSNDAEAEKRRERLRERASTALESELDKFKDFLERKAAHLPTRVTLELIAAQGRTEELLFFAAIKDDVDYVIRHHVVREDFDAAVKTLDSIDLKAQPHLAELFYIHAPDLICARPKETVDVLISRTTLNPVELLPAIVRCTALSQLPPGVTNVRKVSGGDQTSAAANGASSKSSKRSEGRKGAQASTAECEVHAVRFLMHVVHEGHSDQRLHNMLIALLARHSREEPLLRFLEETKDSPKYDPQYALRVCQQEGPARRKACVALYRMQGMYLEAVELALHESNPSLARSVLLEAQSHLTQTPETLKQLWMRFVRKVVENGDVAAALAVLRDDAACILRLEDVLQCLPDFVQIKAFKSEILRSLQGFQTTITNLKAEMDRLTASAERIRDAIHQIQSRHSIVRQNQKCDACSQPVIMRQFLAFACSHVFHADCCYTIAQYYLASNPVRKQSAFRRLIEDSEDATIHNLNVHNLNVHNLTKAQEAMLIETFSQSQCPLCSEVMIDSVQEPFISLEEKEEIESWAI